MFRQSVTWDGFYLRKTINDLPINQQCKDSILHYTLYASKKCRRSKRRYYVYTTITIVVPMLALAFNSFAHLFSGDWSKYILAILSFLSSLAAALLSILRCHDDWIRNRDYLEGLISAIMNTVKQIDSPQASADSPSTRMQLQNDLMENIISITRQHQVAWDNEKKQQAKLTEPADKTAGQLFQ